MASRPITLWQIERETVETVADFIFLGSKITAESDCSHEIKKKNKWRASKFFQIEDFFQKSFKLCYEGLFYMTLILLNMLFDLWSRISFILMNVSYFLVNMTYVVFG